MADNSAAFDSSAHSPMGQDPQGAPAGLPRPVSRKTSVTDAIFDASRCEEA